MRKKKEGKILNVVQPFTANKILALSNLKAFVEDELFITQNMKFVFHTVENIVRKGRKGKNAGHNTIKEALLTLSQTTSF